MSEYEPERTIQPEDQELYDRFLAAKDSLITAFKWAQSNPNIQDADWDDIDEDEQDLRVAELIDELYSYAAGELELPTSFIDDCFTDATDELDKLDKKEQ